MQPRTTREKILLVSLFLVAVSMSYWLFRYRPASRHLQSLQDETQTAEADLAKIRWPQEPARPPEEWREDLRQQQARWEAELEELDALLAHHRLDLQQQTRRSVSTENTTALHELQLQISDAATECGLTILENAPFTPPAAGRAGAADEQQELQNQPLLGGEDLLARFARRGRPLRRMVVQCRYDGFRQFVHKLDTMPWRVTIVQLEIVAQADREASSSGNLEATLMLAL